MDSDDEWEEEEPGESVSSTEVGYQWLSFGLIYSVCVCVCVCVVVTQDEGESGEDDEDDDGFFVPHGYLSDGEGEISDGEVVQYFC